MGFKVINPGLDDFTPMHTIEPNDHDDMMLSVEAYRDGVRHHALTDEDGYGHPVQKVGERYCEDQRFTIIPSMKGADIPSVATHVNWFNK